MIDVFLAPLFAAIFIGTLYKTGRDNDPIPRSFPGVRPHLTIGLIAATLGALFPAPHIAELVVAVRTLPVLVFGSFLVLTFLIGNR